MRLWGDSFLLTRCRHREGFSGTPFPTRRLPETVGHVSETGRKDANICLGSAQWKFLMEMQLSGLAPSSDTGPDTITGLGTARAVSVCLLTRAMPRRSTSKVTAGYLRGEKVWGSSINQSQIPKTQNLLAESVCGVHSCIDSWPGPSCVSKSLAFRVYPNPGYAVFGDDETGD